MSMKMNNIANEIAENQSRQKKKYIENVELRRDWVQRLLIRGNTQWEIAESRDISQPTVSRDIKWLRAVAKKELKNRLEKRLPEECLKYLGGIDEALKHAWDIALHGKVDRTRLDALQFVIECGRHKVDICTNPPVFTKENKYLKPFKSNIDSNGNGIKKSDNGFNIKKKEIKKKEATSKANFKQDRKINKKMPGNCPQIK